MNGADKFAKDSFGNDPEYYFTHEFSSNKLPVSNDTKTNGASNGQTDDEVFDDSSPVIESAIQDKNFDKLVKYVLEGDSERLSGRSSEDEEMQEFIKNIPAFQVLLKIYLFKQSTYGSLIIHVNTKNSLYETSFC